QVTHVGLTKDMYGIEKVFVPDGVDVSTGQTRTARVYVRAVISITKPDAPHPGPEEPGAAHSGGLDQHRVSNLHKFGVRATLAGFREAFVLKNVDRGGSHLRMIIGFGPKNFQIAWAQGALTLFSPGPDHSHSIVEGGLVLTSYTTRFTPGTWLVIRVAIRP